MRTKKTALRNVVNQRKRKKQLADMKMNQSIREVLEQVADSGSTLNEILNETDCLAILNKAKVNNFLNCYITKIFESLDGIATINNRLLEKIIKKKEIVSPSEYVKLYIKGRELENEQMKLVTEFVKCHDVKLDLEEQNMIIIYRALPGHLKRLMYKTVMEFVRTCPAIQRELKKAKENLQDNQ